MKYLYQLFVLLILLGASSCGSSRYYTQSNNSQDDSPQPDITYQQFYNDLSPYGNWVDYPQYGYVWIPGVAGFRPYYTNGYWVYTDYGWTWASNYSWGWAPFHYGRWINDISYGWMWVPGNEWAPAWVSWRSGGDYYGWAPLAPGMNINLSAGSIPADDWAFVPRGYINNQRINNYYVDRSRNVTIINNTTIINNNTTVINNSRVRPAYNPGPSVTEVETVSRTKIRKINVMESNKPGKAQIINNSISVYRPAVKQEPTNSTNIRPSRVTDIREMNHDNRTNANNQSNPPVREFPKDQTPSIKRNEPPARNTPATTPDKNTTPERVLPNNQQHPQINRNEAPVNSSPSSKPDRNKAPVRKIQNNTEAPPVQPNRNQQQPNEILRNSQPVNNNSEPTPQRNIERSPDTRSQNNTRRNTTSKAPVRPGNTGAEKNQTIQRTVVRQKTNLHQSNQKIEKEDKEAKMKGPVRKATGQPQDEKKDN